MAAADVQALLLAAAWVAGASLAFTGNRTLLHVGVGNVAWTAFLFDEPWWAFAGSAALALAAFAAHLRPPSLYRDALAGERDLGPPMFFAGLAVACGAWALLGVGPAFVVLAVLPMAFADPVGFYVGRARGRTRLPNGKSVEGALAVFGVSLVAVLLAGAAMGLGALAVMAAPLAAGGAALGEAFAPRHTDNLLMVVGAALGLLAAPGVGL